MVVTECAKGHQASHQLGTAARLMGMALFLVLTGRSGRRQFTVLHLTYVLKFPREMCICTYSYLYIPSPTSLKNKTVSFALVSPPF